MLTTRFLVIDTETTGLDPSTSGVVEIAAVLVVGGKIAGSFTSYVNPKHPIPPEASAIHGLVDSDVADAPTLAELLPQLNALVADVDVLVAHNAPFDRSMLTGLDEKPWLDTVRLARRVYPKLECHRNGYLRYALNLRCPEAAGMPAHRALSDAYVTARLLLHLLANIPQVPRTVSELIADNERPILQSNCRFGKYKGLEWAGVPRDYLAWVAKQDMDADVLHTAREYLKR